MAKKQMGWKTKGMNRDLSVSAFSPEFAFENMNLRLQTNDGNTLMSWVNEKGTALLSIYKEDENGKATKNVMNLSGTPIGTAIINHYLIIFTKGTLYDFIYRLKYIDNSKTTLLGKILCQSIPQYLNLNIEHPLETLVSYESDLVQKVYWVDGINLPRVINICKEYGTINSEGYCKFDFVLELQLNEVIYIQKQLSGGMFAPGVILYAFTYYNKYGPETNVFYTTPLYYISYKERGASPEDKVENAFKITIENIDSNFEYLRIYSIQRTSINGTPICKRILDIEIKSLSKNFDNVLTASYIDTGTSGESVDPMELLYKGGESIAVNTLEQKDGTIFFGGLSVSRESIKDGMSINGNTIDLKTLIESSPVTSTIRKILPINVSSSPYSYYNLLTSQEIQNDVTKNWHVPCGGFKTGNYYRLGVLFQYKTGKWSDPIFINNKSDVLLTEKFSSTVDGKVTLPIFEGTISSEAVTALKQLGYKRARACFVAPRMLDKDIICLGVAAPTLYTYNHRTIDKDIYALSSWFFRPKVELSADTSGDSNDDREGKSTTILSPKSEGYLRYTQRNIEANFPESNTPVFNPKWMRQVEIEGDFENDNRFIVDRGFRTLHSPDIEFDDLIAVLDFSKCSYGQAGTVYFEKTLSDIDIQTETPTISNNGSGFVHKAFNGALAKGIVSGLFYDDFIVDDDLGDDKHLGAYPDLILPAKWLVYPWQGTGSLNNDINRPSNKGIGSAKLKKKVISNLRYATTSLYTWENRKNIFHNFGEDKDPLIFNSEEDTILKMAKNIYKGNIDTSLIPDNPDGPYFCWEGYLIQYVPAAWVVTKLEFLDKKTSFESTNWKKLFSRNADSQDLLGIREWRNDLNVNRWIWTSGHIGDDFVDLAIKKHPVRIKYKSTPHLICDTPNTFNEANSELAIIEIKHNTDDSTRYGGTSIDALKENTWIPCGKSTILGDNSTTILFEYGDTYFQRYDCLKTYPFTREDLNQIVEIGSFMLETYTNIDGRYDRNRGQSNNLNMSPLNFNLMNPIYSQLDNFFLYKILDDSYYESNNYPNQIAWSKTKENGADIDLWTNVTLSSILELDGNKGNISKLIRLNDLLLCFLETGISQILYNENVLVSTESGVPIEVANSGKVQGKRYLSNTIGCSNKWSMVQTPAGIYFMDSTDKSIYMLGEGLQNISLLGGFNSWCKLVIPSSNIQWSPNFNTVSQEDLRTPFLAVYDKKNQDVLWLNGELALAWNEKVAVFTSFYDYGHMPYFCNLDDTGIWIDNSGHLWKHQAGLYCRFFGVDKPYWMTLVGNPEPTLDKTFTNLEFRACVEGEGEGSDGGNGGIDVFDSTFDSTFHPEGGMVTSKYIPYLPFDYLETWNEYQHGISYLENRNGHSLSLHHTGLRSALNRKFRIWRCDVPCNNYPMSKNAYGVFIPENDSERGIYRKSMRPRDRMRNPWIYLKLMKKVDESTSNSLPKAEIHDLAMTYYI